MDKNNPQYQEVREKIKENLWTKQEAIVANCTIGTKLEYQTVNEQVDSILSILIDEVKSVENPYQLKAPFESNTNFSWRAFESCRESIIKMLEEK